MRDTKESKRGSGIAGGSLLAFGIIGGVIVGTALGQPSIGFLAGFGVGLLLFLLVFLVSRR
jgi:fucose permease